MNDVTDLVMKQMSALESAQMDLESIEFANDSITTLADKVISAEKNITTAMDVMAQLSGLSNIEVQVL